MRSQKKFLPYISLAALLTFACSRFDVTSRTKDSTADICASSTINSIERPKYPTRRDSEYFSFKYQDLASAEETTLPVVLHLSGGPGQAGIKNEDQTFYRQIRIDLRGIGCNKIDVESPAEFFDSEIFASDVVALIEQLKLESYVIEGTSYGTALGTIVASKLVNSAYKPKAMLLEGTVGRAYDQTDIRAAYLSRWDEVWPTLSSQTQEVLKRDAPLGLSKEQWGQALALLLSLGHSSPDEDATVKFLNQALTCDLAMSASDCEIKRAKITPIIEQFKFSGVDPFQDKLYFRTMCSEFSPGGHELDFLLINGKLVSDPTDHCDGITLSKPFLADNFPYSVPTFYFTGGLDVGTPPWQSQYHVNANKQSKRFVITVPKGGHNSFGKGLKDCGNSILKEILTDGGNRLETRLTDPSADGFIHCKMLSGHTAKDIYKTYEPVHR